MRGKLHALACICIGIACTASWAQSPPQPAKPPIKRDVFLVLMKSSMNSACDVPNSPYACMVRTVELCRRNLPVAVDQCEGKMKDQLPVEIPSDETRQWSSKIARCIVDEYVLLVGAANLTPQNCPPRAK
jgi:hypothetical protein